MTREEAIEILKKSQGHVIGTVSRDKVYEATDIATRSLEAWDEVLKELEQTAGNIVYTRWCADLIRKHLKEVEE